ncbi:TPA: phage late control D family protein [Yersinia enterocolitica]|uniref:phage late control D family protein n=1 Tax=Yersinia enterocolitica TaxID=630 RepID=UPI0005EA3B95|nr:phage late control D family protein [Yersinia enterocolitica]ELY5303791.1 phage late control D family protein [Yersinia enterocolitica]CQJ09526.1 regulator of late gene expression [Yersinia enterocolitica]CQQ40216.1 regulator of late gene expression [Yersinia enterocolitica]HDL7725003.1 phage late control D family protein [Yersinia enterocolitica]HEN3286704.1 phage late control D family protein [Yersinia enterocolitica]
MQLLPNDLTPRPAFDIKIGGKTQTTVNDRLISLTLTDNRGFEADMLELVIDDADQKVALPKRGAQIDIALGWKGEPLVNKGRFTVDEISHSGPPDQLIVTARSADFRDTFNVKREYSWHDITVGEVVASIASRYDLKAGVSEDLGKIEIDHADQTSESDISFLTRMAEKLGAITTIKNGMLLFMHPGRAISQSGKLLPAITITRASGDKHSFRVADRDAYTGVTAYWLDLNYGKPQKTSVRRKRKSKTPPKVKTPASTSKEGNYLEGVEGNVFVMRETFKTERAARRAAAARWSKLQRGAAEFTMTLARGRADLFPELPAVMQGFKPEIDQAAWIITQVTHTIGDNGFTTALNFEVKITDLDMAGEETE